MSVSERVSSTRIRVHSGDAVKKEDDGHDALNQVAHQRKHQIRSGQGCKSTGMHT